MQIQTTMQLPPNGNIVSNSATAAAANCVVTLPAVAGRTNFVEGFTVTGTGATAAAIVNTTLSGLAVSNCVYITAFPAGVNTAITTLDIRFPTPLPASAANAAITLNVPSAGSGNSAVAATIYGFNQ